MKKCPELFILLFVLMFAFSAGPEAHAHELRPAYLSVKQTGANEYNVLWKVPAKDKNLRLGLYVRFPKSTENTREPVARFSDGAYIENWAIRVPGSLDEKIIHVDGLLSTLTDVLVRLERLDGSSQVIRLAPESPSFVVQKTPGFMQIASTYLVLGVEHILFGIDHLLFVLALLILVAGCRKLIVTITAFTVAHSVTLALATLGVVNIPAAPVEAIIALSIVFVAAEIVHGHQGRSGITESRPWLVALIFGLLHGLGFAGALSAVGLPQNSIPSALLFFNVGVEVGQLMFVVAALGVMTLGARILALLHVTSTHWIRLSVPYAIGSVSMFWVFDRISGF